MASRTSPRNAQEGNPAAADRAVPREMIENLASLGNAIHAQIDSLATLANTGHIETLTVGALATALHDLEERMIGLNEGIEKLNALPPIAPPAQGAPNSDTKLKNELQRIAQEFWNVRQLSVYTDESNWDYMGQAVIALCSVGGALADQALAARGFPMHIGSLSDWVFAETLDD